MRKFNIFIKYAELALNRRWRIMPPAFWPFKFPIKNKKKYYF